jgi:hypothetical protein
MGWCFLLETFKYLPAPISGLQYERGKPLYTCDGFPRGTDDLSGSEPAQGTVVLPYA